MSARANRQPSPASGNYAKYVGRVGALAVALGIGAVVATGHGFCLEVARADTGSETAGNPSGGDDKKDPADNKPEDKKPDEKKPEDKPEEKKPEEKPEDKKPEEKPGNEPGTGLQGEPEVKPPAVPETNEPPLVTGGGEPAPVPEPHVSEPEGPDVPEVPDIPKIVDGHIDPPRNDSAQQPPAEAPTPPGSSIGGDATAARFAAGGQQPKVSARGLEPSDEQLQPTTMSVTTMTMAVTAPEPAPTPQVRPLQEMVADVVSATQAFVAALLTPFLSPSTPAPPPTLWAVLGWVRREFERAFLNRRPEALPDDVTTSEDGSTTIDVLHNDRDDAGDVTTVVSNTEAEHGTVTLNPDGTFTYTPDPDFHGTDSFTYTITDATSRAHIHGLAGLLFGGTHTSTATVTITVTAKPDAPVANPDTYETDEDTPLTVDAEHGVLHNDTDADGDTLTVQNPGTPITTTNGGTVTIAADGSFTYVPKADATGTDTFGYTVIDGTGRSSGAIATVTVAAQPDGPVASPDAYQTDEDTQLFVDGSNGLLSNDVHPDGGSLYVPPGPSLVPTANGGTVTLLPDGAFVYTPKADFVGTDTFTYTVMDLQGRSTTGTVSITVAAKPDAPVAEPDSYETDEDTPLSVDASDGVLGNDSDADGDTLSVRNPGTVSTTGGGTVTINADGSFTYTPKADFHGDDSFVYKVGDGTGLTATATATITVAAKPDSPVAEPDSYETDEDTPLTVDAADGLLGNDSDADGGTLSVQNPGTPVTTTNGGTVTIAADGSFTYTPKADFHGVDTFSYTVVDGSGLTSTGAVSITIAAKPDSPVAEPDSYETDEDAPLTADAADGLLGNDSDADGGTLSVRNPGTVSTTGGGTVTINADGSFTYTPKADFHGDDSFVYKVGDGTGLTATATATITVAAKPDSPVAEPDSYETDEDTPLTVDASDGLLGNDSDPDGGTLSVQDPGTPITTALGGTVTINADGSFTYVPKADVNGVDTFSYTVVDGTGLTATATATITVAAKPDTLVAANDSYTTDEDTALTVDAEHGVLANDSRGDGATLEVVNPGTITTSTGGTVALNADGSFTYHPVTNWYGTDSFTYTVTDGIDTTTATVSFEIASVNDIPVANDDAYEVNEDNFLNVTLPNPVVGNDSDGDGDIITVKNHGTYTTAEGGTVTIVARGTFTYTPKANWSGEDSFTYTITDGNGGEDTATVHITVVAVNDAPKAQSDNASTDEGTAVVIDILGNDTDVEGDTLGVASFSQPTNGTVTLTDDGKLLYTPNANWYGVETFIYKAGDGSSTSAVAVVTVTVNNVPDAPVIIRTEQSAPDPRTGVITGRIYAADADGPTTFTYGGTYTTENLSTFVVHEDGTFTYTPSLIDRIAEQPFTFGYTVSDGGLTTSGTVGVTNTAPDTSSATQPRVTITYVRGDTVIGHIDGVTDVSLIAGWGTGDPSYLVIDENGDFYAMISRTERYAAYQAAQAGQSTTLQFITGSFANATMYSVVVPVDPGYVGSHEVTVDEERWGNTTTGHIDGVASQYQESPGGSTLVIAPNGDFFFTPSAADQYAASLPGGPKTIRFDTNNASHGDSAPIVLEVEPNADYPYTMTVDYESMYHGNVNGHLDNHSQGDYGTITDTGSSLIVESDGDFTVHFSYVDRYAAQQAGVATYLTFFVPVGDGTKRPVVVRVPVPDENSSI